MLKRLIKNDAANAMVEFGLATPVMLLLTLGAADFGRLFVESAIIAGASQSGAVTGYLNTQSAMDTAAMEAAALADISGLDGVTATASRYCDCPDNPGVPVACATTTCTGFGPPRVYVKSKVAHQFKTLGNYGLIPSSVDMSMDSYLRVQ